MKNRNYFIAIVSLLLVSTMIWLSCEKQNNTTLMNEAQPVVDFEIPVDVAAYFSPAQIKAYYEEVEKEKAILPPAYDLVPVMIKMQNEVLYLKEPGYVRGIQFEGMGTWENQSDIRYFERVIFQIEKSVNPGEVVGTRGEGTIFMQRSPETEDKVLPREDLMTFESKNRVETTIIPRPEDGQTFHTLSYVSKISFLGGYGIFEKSYGFATKIERYDIRQPEKCTAAILGYVFIKKEGPDYPDS